MLGGSGRKVDDRRQTSRAYSNSAWWRFEFGHSVRTLITFNADAHHPLSLRHINASRTQYIRQALVFSCLNHACSTAMSYATRTSASERPLSEGVMGSNVPETENMNGHGTGEPMYTRNTGPHNGKFLLFTFYLGLVAWLICLVSQAVVAATISNAPVRILWFAIILHLILLVLVALVLMGSPEYDTVYAYGTQISVLSALATAFAVIGVDQNIYAPRSSQQATGAGYLIAAIVDLLWIFYFTSPPQSPIMRLAGSSSRAEPGPQNHVEKIQRSTDAFPISPANAGRQEPVGYDVERTEAPPRTSFFNRFTSPQKPKSGLSNVIVPAEGTVASRSTAQAPSAVLNPRAESVALSEIKTEPARQGSPAKAEGEGSVRSDTPEWKAEAMFAYGGSTSDPNEISFKKGEILKIYDKSGKWWDAENAEGKRGIAPSNYLKLVL
ncbi:hypothetical protein CPC08DRAFT_815637 [Agrocybe pediades]|nr:hypothetical protein CPC08DRAFT_815637 [Agrocybe pediades]